MKRIANRRGHEGTQSLRTKQLGKNFAVFIVGADLRVGPRCHVVHRGRGPTRRSAPTMDNAGLFLRECLTASSSVRDGIFGRDRFYQLFFYLKPALTVCELKGLALQLTYGLDFLSIQAYRLWMEHPSRGKVKAKCRERRVNRYFLTSVNGSGFVSALS